MKNQLIDNYGSDNIEGYIADLSNMNEVKKLAEEIKAKHEKIDVIINNAGVFVTKNSEIDGYDVRFLVNTIAPYLLTKLLLPILAENGRVVNLSSAAQAPVNLDALKGNIVLDDSSAYAESKLALTMWSRYSGLQLKNEEKKQVIVAVNPKSFLGSKMVKDAYGMEGHDINIGADIIFQASLSEEFNDAAGKYYDNDKEAFANPHIDALDDNKCRKIIKNIEDILYGFN